MDFERVRTAEQRKIRVEQIKNAAIKLFDEKLFHDITLADIANETSFTRGNLYKYVSSKEEIYLLVMLDELNRWIADLRQTINEDMTNDVDTFSKQWATITYQHQRFLNLFSILFTILERNVALEKLTSFKNELAKSSADIFAILKTAFPTMSDHAIGKFIDYQRCYAIGLYPTTSPVLIQKKALEASTLQYEFPDFADDFSEFITRIIKSLNTD